MAARGLLRAAARRAPARDPRLRRVSPDAPRTAASSTASPSSTRGRATCARSCTAPARGWPESAARREIAGILEVLGKLHRGQMLHRDLTPLNVFVCDGRSLKLGDFGIVRQQSDRRGITARTLNPLWRPSDILAGAAPKWQARDDVYQVGQLLGMLVKGDARARIRTPEIRRLPCSDSPEGDRLPLHRRAAQALRERRRADRGPAPAARRASRPGVLRSLKGVHLAFTGILSMPRSEAARAARRAGATVHGVPSVKTTVVVRGRPEPAAGRGPRRGPEAHGDQAAAREGPPHHPAQRDAVLAPRRRSLICEGVLTTHSPSPERRPPHPRGAPGPSAGGTPAAGARPRPIASSTIRMFARAKPATPRLEHVRAQEHDARRQHVAGAHEEGVDRLLGLVLLLAARGQPQHLLGRCS